MSAVIFDCDGTLVDSEPLSAETWRHVLGRLGYETTDADVAAVVGSSYPRTHAFFASRVALPAPEVLLPELNRVLFGLIDDRLEVFEDAITAVADLRERGVPIAVASGSVRERLNRTLARAGLAFEITVAGDEVEHGKPSPDMFFLAAARLGVAPERCVVVEDSAPGVAAGRAAGMPTLGVRRVPDIDLSAATRVVDVVSADAILAMLS
ncbi:HAD family phosphatase [Solirubrobacter ginsenosidimutans]|uniref:HAD family phosphatase n=1 Tax=Solirubrobacter ginsenosidimutans TaxID=490573 RepID=A0A9X3N0Y1_9ACTN|nr:HAD family phosphatase [Solirubrobacter ginsenosidimutans]MDA0166626.1 HAD family phosphatase [Solirubrobacter ginsenosidimutans]